MSLNLSSFDSSFSFTSGNAKLREGKVMYLGFGMLTVDWPTSIPLISIVKIGVHAQAPSRDNQGLCRLKLLGHGQGDIT